MVDLYGGIAKASARVRNFNKWRRSSDALPPSPSDLDFDEAVDSEEIYGEQSVTPDHELSAYKASGLTPSD